MHAYVPNPLTDNPNRVMPTVPGINASKLQPSIGCDHWRISATQKVWTRLPKGGPDRGARPMTGKVDLSQVPSSFNAGRERRTISTPAPQVTARKRKAQARSAHAARLALFG